MLYWHRLVAVSGATLLLFVIGSGVGIQFADMRALLSHAPATDPDMLMMRQHITGTPGYVVVTPSDYTAATLPPKFDYAASLSKAASLAHAAAPGSPMRLVEVRVIAGRPVGHVQMGERQFGFDLATGRLLAEGVIPRPVTDEVPGSTRLFFKKLHQFRFIGSVGSFVSGLAGLLLAGLIITGLWQFFRVYRMRASRGRKSLFWRGGGLWRQLHRAIAVGCSIVLIWIVGTGILMSIDDIGGSINRMIRPAPKVDHHAAGRRVPAGASVGGWHSSLDKDVSSPLKDAELPAMAHATLSAFHQTEPELPIRVLRLRYYAGYPQGVVIAGDAAASQHVFNAASGFGMSMQERGYPDTGYPYGWEWHQRIKRLHRGDFFGMIGRWLATLGGLAFLYLSVSGIVMYLQMWRQRRCNGRGAFVW